MSKYRNNRELHEAIADEVRAKTGSEEGIKVEDLPEAVKAIPSGIEGLETVEYTVTTTGKIYIPVSQMPKNIIAYSTDEYSANKFLRFSLSYSDYSSGSWYGRICFLKNGAYDHYNTPNNLSAAYSDGMLTISAIAGLPIGSHIAIGYSFI